MIYIGSIERSACYLVGLAKGLSRVDVGMDKRPRLRALAALPAHSSTQLVHALSSSSLHHLQALNRTVIAR